jgi:ERCC4-type nuclease
MIELPATLADIIEKFDPKECSERVFKEVLGVSREMARRISYFFRRSAESDLTSIEGMTEELADKIKKYFRLDKDK